MPRCCREDASTCLPPSDYAYYTSQMGLDTYLTSMVEASHLLAREDIAAISVNHPVVRSLEATRPGRSMTVWKAAGARWHDAVTSAGAVRCPVQVRYMRDVAVQDGIAMLMKGNQIFMYIANVRAALGARPPLLAHLAARRCAVLCCAVPCCAVLCCTVLVTESPVLSCLPASMELLADSLSTPKVRAGAAAAGKAAASAGMPRRRRCLSPATPRLALQSCKAARWALRSRAPWPSSTLSQG